MPPIFCTQERQIMMSKYTEKSKLYTMNYIKDKLDEFKVRVPKGRKEHYQAAAAAAGLSLNQFVVDALNEKIERDQLEPKE